MILVQMQSMDSNRMFHEMSSRFKQGDPGVWWKIPAVLSMLAIAILLVLVLLYLEKRRRKQRTRPRPLMLFCHSLRTIGFSWMDIWRLWRLARALGIGQPTAMLISAEIFDGAMKEYCGTREGRGSRCQNQLVAIRRQIFANAPDIPGPGDSLR